MSTKNFRKNLLENAKKVKDVPFAEKEEILTPGEKYILERKKEPVTEELTLGQRLLQERLSGNLFAENSIITESVETPVVSEDVQETAQMIAEVSEAMPEQRGRRVTPDTEDGRLLEYIDTIKSTTETSQQKSLIEQDLQNTAATMADLANLRSVVTRLQTSLTSLGGGGIGYQEVKQMIEDGDYNIDSADLKALEIKLEEYVESYVEAYVDSSIDARLDSAVYTTDDVAEASNLYYTDARADSAVARGFDNRTTTDLAEGSNLYYTQARFDSAFAKKTTSNLTEGGNLYYTQARFDSAFGQKTTSNLTEGSNLYYTDDRVDANFAAKTTDDLSQGLTNKYYDSSLFNADFAAKNTDDLSEGSNNLYYTDARVTSLVDSAYVQERVTLEAGVHFKGVVNFANDSAPVDPEAGDLYIADSDAVANASWAGIAGELIQAQHGVVWANADSSWHALGSTSVDASVYVERSGDTMTGTLSLESGNLVVQEGDVTLDNGNINLREINAKVSTNNIENGNGSEYVKIYKDGTLKAAFKAQEIVSYQPHTYPNNIAADISATGTDQTLIHKGYVDSEFVSKFGGDAMQGPLTITAVDPSNGRDTNKVKTLGVFSGSDVSALRLGTTRDRVYIGHDETQINGPLHVGEIKEKNAGQGTTFPNSIEVQDTLKAKNITPGNLGKILVEGWVDGTNPAAEILMSNKQFNADAAYGKLTFHGTSASNAWFQFDKDLDMSTKGLHSVDHVRLTGNMEIQEGTTTRIKFNNKVEIPRVGDNKDGFTIFGRNNTKLLSAFHNVSGTADAVNYTGRQQAGSANLATVKFVEDQIAGIAKTWPGRRFKFSAYAQGTNVPIGYISPNGSGSTTTMFISAECIDGIRISHGSPDYTPGVTMTFSLFEFSDGSNSWRQKGLGTFGGEETDYRSGYIRFNGFTWKQTPELIANATYAIVISSMWG